MPGSHTHKGAEVYDNYADACEAVVSRKEAIREIRKHGVSVNEFLADCGDKDEYTGQVVLDWLGY
jgi:hypothetical protein